MREISFDGSAIGWCDSHLHFLPEKRAKKKPANPAVLTRIRIPAIIKEKGKFFHYISFAGLIICENEDILLRRETGRLMSEK